MKSELISWNCNLAYTIIFFFAFLLILVSCDESTTNPPTSIGKIIGTVKDTNGNLLHDVDVHIVYQLVDETSGLDKGILSPDDVIYGEMTATVNLNLKVELWWETSSETNNQGFDIERKFYEDEYEKIGFVNGSGTTTEYHSYSFADSNITGGNYSYRFKHIAFDGTFGYSQVLEISTLFSADIDTLYQNFSNPFIVRTDIRYDLKQQSNCKLDIKKFNSNQIFTEIFSGVKEKGYNKFIFENPNVLPNNLYKIEFKAEAENSNYTQTIFALKNDEDPSNLVNAVPFTKTVNGEFEINIADLPINKKVLVTSSSYEVLKEQVIGNTLKFVLYKPGYHVLHYDYLIDTNKQNEFNFVLEIE